MRIPLAVLLAGVLACGSKQPTAAPAPGGNGPAATPDAGAAVPDPGVPDQAPLSEDECARMINHLVDIGLETQRRGKKPEELPAAEQVTEIRSTMVREMMPECLRFDRASWRCAMNATTSEQVTVCAGAEPAPAP